MTDNRDYPARPILAASAAVFKPDGTVLLGARRAGPYSGVFSLPGGLSVGTNQTISPRAGRLVMFPSWVLHQVRPYRGTAQRISIAFNLSL